MSIATIKLSSTTDDSIQFDSTNLEFALDGKVKLEIESDPGVISAFWYGPEMKGRLGDSFSPPRSFFIQSIQPGEHKVVIEQYRFGKLIDLRVWAFTVLPVVHRQPSINLGLVDLGRIDPAKVVELLKPINVRSTREWFNTSRFSEYRPRDFSRLAIYAQAGINPVFCFAESNLSPDKIVNVENWVTQAIHDIRGSLPGVKFRIEMGNEINLQINSKGSFWDCDEKSVPAKVRRYVELVQKPMYETVKSIDSSILCIAPSFSWDYRTLEKLADDLLEYADALAFHPYCNGLKSDELLRVDQSIQTARKRNVPLIYTESQLNYGKKYRAGQVTQSKWAEDVIQYLLYAHQARVDEQHYFVAIDAGTTNSPAAVFASNNGNFKTTPFYDSILKINSEV